MIEKIKEWYYKSFIYSIYLFVVRKPIYRFFTDYYFFKGVIFNIRFIKKAFNNYKTTKLVIFNLRKDGIRKSELIYLLWLAVILPAEYWYINIALIVYFLGLFLSDNTKKEDSFLYFVLSIAYISASALLSVFLSRINFLTLLKIWCCASVFIFSAVYNKNENNIAVFANLVLIFVLSTLLNIFYNIIMLTPFVCLGITFLRGKRLKILILAVVSSIILKNAKADSLEFWVLVSEIVLFCLFSGERYGLIIFLIMPTAILKLINRLMVKFFSETQKFDLKSIWEDVSSLIKNGIKGAVRDYYSGIIENFRLSKFYHLTGCEKVIMFIVFFVVLLFTIFLGKYIFRLIRKTALLVIKKNRKKSYVAAAVAFFSGTIVYMLFSENARSILSDSFLYWFSLGVLKSFIKNNDQSCDIRAYSDKNQLYDQELQ